MASLRFIQRSALQKWTLVSLLFSAVSAFLSVSPKIYETYITHHHCRSQPLRMESTEFNLMSLNKIKKINLNVQDVDQALSFYKDGLGMVDMGEACVGFSDFCALQFQKTESTETGEQLKGLGLLVPDVAAAVESLVAAGGQVVDEPQELVFGPSIIPDEPVEFKDPKMIALVKDPNGIELELTQSPDTALSKVRLLVTNLEKNIEFYEALGMKLLRKRALLPRVPALTGYMGYGSEEDVMIELVYEYGVDKLAEGSLFGGVEVTTLDVAKGLEAMEAANVKPVESSSKEASFTGPDGHGIKLVE